MHNPRLAGVEGYIYKHDVPQAMEEEMVTICLCVLECGTAHVSGSSDSPMAASCVLLSHAILDHWSNVKL